MLCVAMDVAGFQMVRYLADREMLYDLARNTDQSNRTVVGQVILSSFLVDRGDKGLPPVCWDLDSDQIHQEDSCSTGANSWVRVFGNLGDMSCGTAAIARVSP